MFIKENPSVLYADACLSGAGSPKPMPDGFPGAASQGVNTEGFLCRLNAADLIRSIRDCIFYTILPGTQGLRQL